MLAILPLTRQFSAHDACTDTGHLHISPLTALPTKSDPDDTWCIDPRGILTLCLSKQPYERLGLVGKKLPFKGCQELHGTQLILSVAWAPSGQASAESEPCLLVQLSRSHFGRKRRASPYVQGKRRRSKHGTRIGLSLGTESGRSHLLEEVRQFLLLIQDPAPINLTQGLSMGTVNKVEYQVRQFADVFIPAPELARSKEESKEEWEERVSELFEWVGMACLGAQR